MARKRKAKIRQDFKPTQPQATTSESRIASGLNPESDDAPYQLWCLVEGDSTLFMVTSPSNINVDGLKKLIHEQRKQGVLQGVDAKDLVLLKYDHPMPDDDDALSTLEFNDRRLRLSSQHRVSKYWPSPPPDDKIHVFVKKPAARPGAQLDLIDELTETLSPTKLETLQDVLVKAAINAPSPSVAAALNKLLVGQRTHPLYNGRPRRGIPVQLYHPSFAKSLRNFHDDTVELELKPESYAATHALFHYSAQMYEDEVPRTAAIRPYLSKAIHHTLDSLDISGMTAEGCYRTLCKGLYSLVVLEEVKNEIGTGGCDPSHQATMGFRQYYARDSMKPIRDFSCCPCFLIALAGPWICILGAVFVEHVVVQELTDFIWIGGHPYNDERLVAVTRLLAALGQGMTELEIFYNKLSPGHSKPDPQRFFPFIKCYRDSDEILVNFSYQSYLTHQTPEGHSKPIYLAITEVNQRQVVVKFVQRYNAVAHRLLAKEKRAPELLYCSSDDPKAEDLAGLIMVVMEYIEGETAHDRYGINPLPSHIFDQVQEAIGILHSTDLVFADLRPPNIMITKDDHVMLVDFDWCGQHGSGKYPFTLNDAKGGIIWHTGVHRGGVMAKEHDNFRLDQMKAL